MAIDSILLVEPDQAQAQRWAQALRTHHLHVTLASTGLSALTELSNTPVDWILFSDQVHDMPLPDLLRADPIRLPGTPVLFLAQSEASAAKGMQQGATDYLLPPYSASQLELALAKASAFRRWFLSFRLASRPHLPGLLHPDCAGSSPALERLRQSIRKLARTDATLLIQGESGSGKSLVAREIHAQSPRVHGPLIWVNCAGPDPKHVPCLLFGEERLNAEGVRSRQMGGLEAAHEGTLVLEDISLAPPSVQAGLLQFLQNRSFHRVGGKEELFSNVRLIATTERSLAEQARQGTFREDLFHTLNILPLDIPPLRDRTADIPILASHFRSVYSRKAGLDVPAISATGMKALLAHDWPGNVRELEGVIARAVRLLNKDGILEADHLFPAARVAEALVADAGASAAAPAEDLASIEKLHIFAMLKQCQDNRTHAAKRLGISIRTLRNKLREYRREAQGETTQTSESD